MTKWHQYQRVEMTDTQAAIWGLIGLAIISVAFWLFCLNPIRGCFSSSSSSPSHDIFGSDRKVAASYMARQFVEGRLLSPGTAKWPFTDDVDDLGFGQYRVTSWVDATNAFGGSIRYNWEAILQEKPGGEWKLESLTGIP